MLPPLARAALLAALCALVSVLFCNTLHVTSTGDQVAAGISTAQHTHTGVQPGGGSTGEPQ